jgi:phosphatidylglycerophosphate synthase
MVVQFVTLAYVVLLVALWKKPEEVAPALLTIGHILVWMTLVVTVMSGLVYLVQTQKFVRKRDGA